MNRGNHKQHTYHVLAHDGDVIMSAMASQITSLTIVYLTIYAGTDQRKYQSSASLAFVRRIHRWPVDSLHNGPVTQKMFPFDGVFRLRIFQAKLLAWGPVSCNGLNKIIAHWRSSRSKCCWRDMFIGLIFPSAVSPVLTHWIYCFLTLDHRYDILFNVMVYSNATLPLLSKLALIPIRTWSFLCFASHYHTNFR